MRNARVQAIVDALASLIVSSFAGSRAGGRAGVRRRHGTDSSHLARLKAQDRTLSFSLFGTTLVGHNLALTDSRVTHKALLALSRVCFDVRFMGREVYRPVV